MKQLMLITVILLFTWIYSACEKSSSELCGGDKPDKTLPWLKKEIERLDSLTACHSISRSTYKNQTVFILLTCDPWVDSRTILFNCDGKKLDLTTAEYQNLNFTGAIELIWKDQ